MDYTISNGGLDVSGEFVDIVVEQLNVDEEICRLRLAFSGTGSTSVTQGDANQIANEGLSDDLLGVVRTKGGLGLDSHVSTQAAASGAAAAPLPFGNVSCGHVDWVNPPPTAAPARPLDAPLRSESVVSSPHAVALRHAAQWLEAHVVELGAMTARAGDGDVQQPLALVAW